MLYLKNLLIVILSAEFIAKCLTYVPRTEGKYWQWLI